MTESQRTEGQHTGPENGYTGFPVTESAPVAQASRRARSHDANLNG